MRRTGRRKGCLEAAPAPPHRVRFNFFFLFGIPSTRGKWYADGMRQGAVVLCSSARRASSGASQRIEAAC